MKSISLLLLILLIITACQPAQNPPEEPAMESEWIVLFDGTSTEHWKTYNSDEFPSQGWQIEGDELVFRQISTDNWTSDLDIISREQFQDFELEMEWNIAEGGNSGIFYFVIEQPEKAIYWSGLEMQIIDNENHEDATRGVDGNRKATSLYDLIPADPQNAKPFGEWNHVKIISIGPKVEHWMNGEKVLEFERFTAEWDSMLVNSKFVDHPEFGAATKGHIGLQDHGDVVRFRNIRIRKL